MFIIRLWQQMAPYLIGGGGAAVLIFFTWLITSLALNAKHRVELARSLPDVAKARIRDAEEWGNSLEKELCQVRSERDEKAAQISAARRALEPGVINAPEIQLQRRAR